LHAWREPRESNASAADARHASAEVVLEIDVTDRQIRVTAEKYHLVAPIEVTLGDLEFCFEVRGDRVRTENRYAHSEWSRPRRVRVKQNQSGSQSQARVRLSLRQHDGAVAALHVNALIINGENRPRRHIRSDLAN